MEVATFGEEVLRSLRSTWPLFSVVAAAVAFFGVFLGLAARIFQQDASFEQFRDWMRRRGLARRYRDLISGGLAAAARIYGDSLRPNWRGYVICLVLACTYPIFLWVLAWVRGGPSVLGGGNLLNDAAAPWRRWLGFAALFGVGLFVGAYLRYGPTLLEGMFAKLNRQFDRWIVHRTWSKLMASVIVVIVVSGVGGVVVASIVGVVGTAGITGMGAMACVAVNARLTGVAGATGFKGVAVGAVGAVVVVVAVVAAGAIGAGLSGVSGVFLTLIVLVPCVNAALDHVSVQVSRWLLGDLIQRAGPWQWLAIIGHVATDIAAAIACLVGLALLMPLALQLVNRGFVLVGWPPVEWLVYLDAARTDPGAAGLFVTGMLATTLIPTVLHLLAAGVALMLPAIGGGTIEQLATKGDTTHLDRVVLTAMVLLTVVLSGLTLWFVAVVLWAGVDLYVGPVGIWLADLAEWSGRMVGGPGSPGA